MRSFCCGSISAKSDLLGAACQSASSSSLHVFPLLALDGSIRRDAKRLGIHILDGTAAPCWVLEEAGRAARGKSRAR